MQLQMPCIITLEHSQCANQLSTFAATTVQFFEKDKAGLEGEDIDVVLTLESIQCMQNFALQLQASTDELVSNTDPAEGRPHTLYNYYCTTVVPLYFSFMLVKLVCIPVKRGSLSILILKCTPSCFK